MKVSDLIAELQRCEPDAQVVLAADSEGNSFEPLAAVQDEIAVKEYGGLEVIHPDDAVEYEEDELVTVVVLWP